MWDVAIISFFDHCKAMGCTEAEHWGLRQWFSMTLPLFWGLWGKASPVFGATVRIDRRSSNSIRFWFESRHGLISGDAGTVIATTVSSAEWSSNSLQLKRTRFESNHSCTQICRTEKIGAGSICSPPWFPTGYLNLQTTLIERKFVSEGRERMEERLLMEQKVAGEEAIGGENYSIGRDG